MSEQAFDPEQQLGQAIRHSAELARLIMTEASEAALSRRLYDRVPWDKVNQFAAEGWELTAVMSDGMHVMQRRVGTAEQITSALARIVEGP